MIGTVSSSGPWRGKNLEAPFVGDSGKSPLERLGAVRSEADEIMSLLTQMYKDLDIIWAISRAFVSSTYPARDVCCVLLGAHADEVVIGAWESDVVTDLGLQGRRWAPAPRSHSRPGARGAEIWRGRPTDARRRRVGVQHV